MNDLGFLGISQACKGILEGIYNPLVEVDLTNKELLK